LLNINVFNPVDVGAFGYRHIDFLNGKCGVVYPKIAFKSQLVFTSWVKQNVVTFFVVNIGAVS